MVVDVLDVAQAAHPERLGALRRPRRRTAARAPLRSACETFDDLGAVPWADRARAGLRATGESRAEPAPDGRATLTPRSCRSSGWPRTG